MKLALGCVLAAAALTACTASASEDPVEPADSGPIVGPVVAPPPVADDIPAAPAGPASFVFDGKLTQGGWIRGQVPAGTMSARLGETELELDEDGRFFAAFDRDAGTTMKLVAVMAARSKNGSENGPETSALAISPRKWNIEHINAARRPGGSSAAFMARRRPELERIYAARAVNAISDGWRQDFIWPVKGRISGRFGSQRVYRGEPGSYHSGLDISTGTSGTPFVAPADGVVVLAADKPFSLEGNLLIIDHGMGLNSAFLHASRIEVKQGQQVKQGQIIGRIGATGRVTGPHLHWSLKWRDARLDPLLFLGPMN